MKIFTRIFIFVAMPLGIIWALNTLLNLGIPYNWKTWLAMMVLMLVLAIFLFPLAKERKESNGRSDRTSL